MPKKERDTMSKKTKRYLMLLVAVGLIAVAAGGSGTFAGFNAEVANNGNFFKTGTLFLHDTANGITCTSESAANNQNLGSGDTCNYIFQATLGSSTGVSYYPVTLTNAGTLSAGSISFYTRGAQACTTTADQTLNNGTSTGALSGVSSIPVSNLVYGMPSGTVFTVDSQTFTSVGAVGPGSTSITVTSPTVGAITAGSVITFQPFANGIDLCAGLDVSIVEANSANTGTGTQVGCAWPIGSSTPCPPTSAQTLATLPNGQGNAAGLTVQSGTNSNSGTTISPNNSRYFWIAVKPDVGFGNTFQNKRATVDLAWHIDQA
jgi:hypothetical protein